MAVLEASIQNSYWSNEKRKLICVVDEETYEIPVTELTCNPNGMYNYIGVIRRIFKTGKVRFDFEPDQVPSIRRYEIQTISSMSEGSIVNVKVVRTFAKGVFCVLENGTEGFIPISEISKGRITSLCDFIKEDEVFPAKIIKIVKDDWSKITLSRRQGIPDDCLINKLGIGDVTTVRIIGMENEDGFLCELDPQNVGFINTTKNLTTGEVCIGLIKSFKADERFWKLKKL